MSPILLKNKNTNIAIEYGKLIHFNNNYKALIHTKEAPISLLKTQKYL
ncbi:hypothetical protein PL373_07135 [Tenacibaculum maritimum]|nr:hypothetical protein [Tenacibaculum maritimum]MDB0600919.1 hypothetical protein [Tenacibaculum maritimum]MDB0611963.1 hypothetical protein [Tenacibaculum maritimum]